MSRGSLRHPRLLARMRLDTPSAPAVGRPLRERREGEAAQRGAALRARVLHVNTVATGSTGRIAVALCEGIEDAGGRAWIAYGRGAAPARVRAVRIGGPTERAVHGLLTRVLDRHGLGSSGATRDLLGALRSLAPDVVHLHNLHGYYLNFEVLFEALAELGVPIVWTLHDCWAFTGHCPYYDRVGCGRWQTGCGSCPLRREYPASWLVDASATMFERKRRAFTSAPRTTLVTPSTWLAREVGRSFLRMHPVVVVPNGIDQAAWAPQPAAAAGMRARLNLPEGRPVLLGVGGFHPRKGMEYLVELGRRLSPEVTVVIVGVTASQLPPLPAGVLALGRIERASELAALYALASVFVNPTLEDNFPNVNLEALAAGTPVVTFASGGCAEQVSPGTGAVVAPRDVDGLAAAVRGVLALGRDRFEEACRARASTFSLPAMVRSYLRVYRSALQG